MKNNPYSHRERARELRRQMTREEIILWDLLRGRKFKGLKFRRQHPLYTHYNRKDEKHYYYADFYCAELRLVIEIDGPIHSTRLDYDRIRDARMLEARYRVLRIPTSMFDDIDAVLSTIDEATQQPPSLQLVGGRGGKRGGRLKKGGGKGGGRFLTPPSRFLPNSAAGRRCCHGSQLRGTTTAARESR